MDKKHIKIIKHLHTQLQKKDKFKNEFDNTSHLIFLYFFSFYLFITFIIISFNLTLTNNDSINLWINTIFSCIFAGLSTKFLLLKLKLKLFNNLVSKKLNKYDIFNSYGRNYDFDTFLFNILEDIIKSNEKEFIEPYIKEIIYIINSITKESIKNSIKIKFIEKIEIDSDTYKLEEDLTIKNDCKSIVFNN